MSTVADRLFWKSLAAAGLAHALLLGFLLSIGLDAPKLERPKPVEVVWVEEARAAVESPLPPVAPTPAPPASRLLAVRSTPPDRGSTPHSGSVGETSGQPSDPAASEVLLGTTLPGKTLSHAELFPSTLEGLGLGGAAATGAQSGTPGEKGSPRTGGLLDAAAVTALIQADARATQARIRADRSLHSKVLRDYGSKLEDTWEVRLEEVQQWPIRPELKLAHPGPESMRDFKPTHWRGLDVSDPCGYERYSLGQVRMVIDRTGRLLERTLVQTSGSRRLDREVLRLVDQSAPFEAPEPLDLGKDGLSRSIWDIGVRDYTRSSCFTPGQKPLVKDILLVALEP